MATLQPMTPLQPLMQASMKPPSPLHAPEQQPLKPPSPLQPKNAPKTPISHPQRRWGFQLRLALREQRRRRFHARDFQCTRAIAGPGRASIRRAEPHISDQAPLCGGRRRERRARLRHPRAMAGPGRGAGGRRQGQGGPPPTGTHSGRAPQPGPPAPGTPAAPCCGDGGNRTPVPTRRPEHQGSNKQPSNARTPERHSKKGPASADPLRECPHSSMRDTLMPPTSEATTL